MFLCLYFITFYHTALRIVLPIHRMYFYYVTSFSLFVMSCVCQLFNKEYMMMI